MICLSKVLRWIALSILFGGSASIVFAAIVLVKAAEGQGIPVVEAANANAPIFIQFSKVSLTAGIVLLLSECLHFTQVRYPAKLTMVRYAASIACIATTMIFTLGIVPPMEELRPMLKTDIAARQEFHHLHELSRAVFGITIISALVSLLIPAFEETTCAKSSLKTQ